MYRCAVKTQRTERYVTLPLMQTPGDRLIIARERAKLGGPTEAARKFGWNEATYKSHENGNRGIRKDVAERYARAFHVSASWILTGIGPADGPSSDEEAQLLANYRRIPEPGQRAVRAVIESYLPRDAVLPLQRTA